MRMEKKYLDILFFLPAHPLLVLLTNQIKNRNHLMKSPCNTVISAKQGSKWKMAPWWGRENGSMVGQRKWRMNSTSYYRFAIVSRIKTKFLTWPTMSYTVEPGWSIQCLLFSQHKFYLKLIGPLFLPCIYLPQMPFHMLYPFVRHFLLFPPHPPN